MARQKDRPQRQSRSVFRLRAEEHNCTRKGWDKSNPTLHREQRGINPAQGGAQGMAGGRKESPTLTPPAARAARQSVAFPLRPGQKQTGTSSKSFTARTSPHVAAHFLFSASGKVQWPGRKTDHRDRAAACSDSGRRSTTAYGKGGINPRDGSELTQRDPPKTATPRRAGTLKVLDPILWYNHNYSTPLQPNHRRHTFTTAAAVCLGCGLSLNITCETCNLHWALRVTCTIEMFVTPSSTHVVLFIH